MPYPMEPIPSGGKPVDNAVLSASSLTPQEWLSAGQTRLVKGIGRHADQSLFLSTGDSPSGTPYRKLALYAIKKDAGLRPKWPGVR